MPKNGYGTNFRFAAQLEPGLNQGATDTLALLFWKDCHWS